MEDISNSTVKATRSGAFVNFLKPEVSTIVLEDIGFALSNICRFTGHVEFYSVAQHSVLVSNIVSDRFALEGLLHDATEAYLGDVHSPLKKELKRYQEIEVIMHEAIRKKFGLVPEPQEVKDADLILLATEHRDMFPPNAPKWSLIDGVKCLSDVIVPMTPKQARQAFFDRFDYLTKVRHGCPAFDGDCRVGAYRSR